MREGCNGTQNCHEEFTSNYRSIFNGKYLAVVMPDRDASRTEVSLKAEEAGAAEIWILVRSLNVNAGLNSKVKTVDKLLAVPWIRNGL